MLTAHHLKIIETLKHGWRTQMDLAKMGVTLNLSKRLCEIEPEIALIGWQVQRQWQDKPRCKQYRIIRKPLAKVAD